MCSHYQQAIQRHLPLRQITEKQAASVLLQHTFEDAITQIIFQTIMEHHIVRDSTRSECPSWCGNSSLRKSVFCGGHGENSSGAFPGVAVSIVFSSYGHVQSVPLSLCQQAGHSKLFCSAASLNSCYRTSIHTSHRQPCTQSTAPAQPHTSKHWWKTKKWENSSSVCMVDLCI